MPDPPQATRPDCIFFAAAPIFIDGGSAFGASLEEAIAKAPQGTEKGQIDPSAQPGVFGIPGSPKINPFVAFLWAIWVGWIFSTAGKISFSQYQGWFGLCVFLIAAFMIYEMSPKGQASEKAAKAAVKAFEDTMKSKGDITNQGVKTLQWSLVKTEISFFGQTFSFSPLWAFVGGFLISALASFIGVGGGFLYAPFLTSVVGLPMFVVAGTSALSVLIGMIFSIFNYMVLKGVVVYWPMIGAERSPLSPRTSFAASC